MSDLALEQQPSRRLWILAGLTALALHIGGAALAFAHLRNDDIDESLGAPAIEIGLESAQRLAGQDVEFDRDQRAMGGI